MSITAVIRLKDEAQWLPLCLFTIQDLFDEILLCTQGKQKDNTIDICKEHISDKIKHYHYQWDSRPNGSSDFKYQSYNQFSRAYFYNWCFDKAETEWVCKWDGDMLALPQCKKYFETAIAKNSCLKFKGVDVVDDLYHISNREFCSPEIRLYKTGRYDHGEKCEVLSNKQPNNVLNINEPLFIHTKWAKEEYSITKAWPENWKQIQHFQNLWKRKQALRKHNYRIPEEWLNHI
jgi:glycosyltransferase involved in cell wall biosynthesis